MVDPTPAPAPAAEPPEAAPTALELLEETVEVGRRRIETGRVRVRTRTIERPVQLDESLTQERVEVFRVKIGRQVDDMPPIREEDGVTIVPVVEEVLVVERRLMLVEEVHLRRVHHTEKYQEVVTLRSQEAVIERDGVIVEPTAVDGVDRLPSTRE